MATEEDLIRILEEHVAPLGFKRATVPDAVGGVPLSAAWVRKTWNTNRGIACIRVPPGGRAGETAQAIKIDLGKALGYFPFFYGIGLQVVCLVPSIDASTASHVDTIDNQRSIVQSLFTVDLERGVFAAERTWGQVITGRFQDAIEAALKELFGDFR
jgi:hypothetical protein